MTLLNLHVHVPDVLRRLTCFCFTADVHCAYEWKQTAIPIASLQDILV